MNDVVTASHSAAEIDRSALLQCNTRFTVIAVQNYAGSGSLFLQSLLDGHPQALFLPATYGIQFYVSWAIRMDYAATTGMDYEKMKQWVFQFFAGLYDPEPTREFGLTELGEKMDQNAIVDKAALEHSFDILVDRIVREENLPPASQIAPENINAYRTVCLRAIYLAYAHCSGRDLEGKRFLVYPAHSSPMRDVAALCSDHPEVLFVHMVREPVACLDSMQRRLSDLTKTSLPNIDVFSCVVNQIYYDRAPQAPVCGVPLYSIYPYPTSKPGRSIAVRLEDVHMKSHETLQRLCQFLGLDWNECLLESTFSGKKWWNLPGLRRVSGFSASMVGREPQFGAFDKWRLAQLAAPIRERFGYLPDGYQRSMFAETMALILSILLPFGLEFRLFSLCRHEHAVREWSKGRSFLARVRRRAYRLLGIRDSYSDAPLHFLDRALLFSALPALALSDYVEHRYTILRGFVLNRAPTTRFVELMKG